MVSNLASWDRIARFVIGAAGIGAGYFMNNWIIGVVGGILLITAFINFCPIYAVLKISTKPKNPGA